MRPDCRKKVSKVTAWITAVAAKTATMTASGHGSPGFSSSGGMPLSIPTLTR